MFYAKEMKYKTLYYDVTAFASRLPDDCLQIIAKYAYDKSRYLFLERIQPLQVIYSGHICFVSVRLYVTSRVSYMLLYGSIVKQDS